MEYGEGSALKLYRLMKKCKKMHFNFLAKLIYFLIQIVFNCVIPSTVEIGERSRIAHGVGIVIHHNTIIGKECVICQNVSITNGNVYIGDNVLIGAGSVIIGPCNIGSNVKIGANTVVNFDVPDNCTVVGMKGRIINRL